MRDVAVGSEGQVYVADFGNGRLQVFASDGTFLRAWPAGDDFHRPLSLAVDSAGSVYVLFSNERVQKFNSDGSLVTAWGSRGNAPGQFLAAEGITVSPDGTVYVSDRENHRIQVFAPRSGPPPPSPTPYPTSPATPLPSQSVTLCPTESISDTLTISLPSAPTRADILFALGSTARLDDFFGFMRTEAATIMDNLSDTISDVHFGVVEFTDVPFRPYGSRTDRAYLLWQPLTADREQTVEVIDAIWPLGGGDMADAYTRTLYETYTDTRIGWRKGTRRFVVMFGDTWPHDDDLNAGVPEPQPWRPGEVWQSGYAPSYLDPGRDEQPGTADDLDFQTVLLEMRSRDITLLYVDSNWQTNVIYPDLTQAQRVQYWRHWAGLTSAGGTAVGLFDPHDLAQVVESVVGEAGRHIGRLDVQVHPTDYAAWVSISPPAYTDLTVPAEGTTVTFDVTVTVPAEVTSGVYTFDVEAVGDGAIYGGREYAVEVPASCWQSPTPTMTPIPTLTPTPTPTPTPTSTPTPTPTATATPTPTSTPTATPTPAPRFAYLPALLHNACWIAPPSDPNTIRLPRSGTVRATILSADADCAGPFSLWSPARREIFSSYQDVGASQELGRFECGTELVFAITAGAQCGGETYLSTDPARARITRQGADRWLLEWEDWADEDFNDSVVLIEVE